MKIIKSRVHDIKFIDITADIQDSFVYLENRSNLDMKKRGLDNLFSTFAYSGMLDGFCVIVTIEIEHEGTIGNATEFRAKISLDSQVKTMVHNIANQIDFNINI